MKGKVIFGALLVSVALSGQVFGFELLDNLLGLNRGGCGPCQPAACEPAAVAACEPACVAPAACQPGCAKPNCCEPRIRPVRDLFDGLECLAKRRLGCCESSRCPKKGACGPAAMACAQPVAVAVCEPAVMACDPVAVCEPAMVACDPVAACHPAVAACGGPAACGPRACKPRCRPVLDLLQNLFGRKCCPKPTAGCGPMACGPAAWECGVTNGHATPAPAPTNGEEAAPLPPAPDPSASIIRPRQLHTASRTLAQY